MTPLLLLAGVLWEIFVYFYPKSQNTRKKEQIQDIHSVSKKIFLARLPLSEKGLFGREKELNKLDQAWDDTNTKIISFVAWGGVGKSALINQGLRNK